MARNVAPYHIVGGNPAEVIKQRFGDELVEYLLQLQWWNWPPEKIVRNLEALCSPDLDRIRKIAE